MATVTASNITLVAGQSSLQMMVGENGWTSMVLHHGGVAETLGAEMLGGLMERLSAFLKEPPSTLRWVFTLSETHSTAYGCAAGDKSLLRFQDRDGKFFAELELTNAERLAWLRQLESIPQG